jgi:hypothetical protein
MQVATLPAKDITGVRDHLLVVFNALRSGEMEAKEAVEINNTAGKIMSSLKVQLAYYAMREERPEIEFLNSPPTTKTIENEKQGEIEDKSKK